MSQSQVDGCNVLLTHWEFADLTDLRWLAYILATAKWETAHTMQPIEEYGHGAGKPYGEPDPETGQIYYGRGFVQLTWRENYQKMQDVFNVPFVTDAAQALNREYAAGITFHGMQNGTFTGVGLSRYFNATTDDPIDARRIINGTDHASDIAVIHHAFLEALS